MDIRDPLQFYSFPLAGVDCSELQGKLIVVEGPDAVGRSTQITQLRQWLEAEGHAVLDTGMAMSAQRTGRSEEAAQFVDKINTMLPDTAYQAAAKQWKLDPAGTVLTCKSCHAPGRLAAKLEALKKG